MKNVPPTWGSMSRHAQACYLVNAHRAKDYRAAQKMLEPANPPMPSMRQTRELMERAGMTPDGKGGIIHWYQKD